jgi:hypothetical protein
MIDTPASYRTASTSKLSMLAGSNLLPALAGPQVREQEYDLVLQPDINTRAHTQWFYFAILNTQRNKRWGPMHSPVAPSCCQVDADPQQLTSDHACLPLLLPCLARLA